MPLPLLLPFLSSALRQPLQYQLFFRPCQKKAFVMFLAAVRRELEMLPYNTYYRVAHKCFQREDVQVEHKTLKLSAVLAALLVL